VKLRDFAALVVCLIVLVVTLAASADDDSAALVTSSAGAPWGVLLAALSGFVALALWLLRSAPRVDEWLAGKRLKWAKPALGALLGAAGAALALAVAGQTDPQMLANAALAGLVAGLGATGAHQVATGGNRARPGR
jgi:hypothetical protein